MKRTVSNNVNRLYHVRGRPSCGSDTATAVPTNVRLDLNLTLQVTTHQIIMHLALPLDHGRYGNDTTI